MLSTVRSITVGGGGGTICTEFVVATFVVAVVDTWRLVRLVRLKSFSPMNSESEARCKRCYCADVVVAVPVVVVPMVAVLGVSLVTLDVVAVLVADAVGLDHISWVLGHPLDQSLSGAVCINLTVCGCSLRCGITMVY